jgi:hypothetical protein
MQIAQVKSSRWSKAAAVVLILNRPHFQLLERINKIW